jgi:hypothetical protein
MTAAEYEHVLRLRKEGKRWHGIVQLKYPNYSPTTIRYGFLKMMRNGGKEDAEVKMPPALKTSAADCVEIARLLRKERHGLRSASGSFQRGATGLDCTERAPRKKMLSDAGKDTKVGIPRKFQPSAADCLEVASLRAKGMSWPEITELKFLGWSHDTVSRKFLLLQRMEDRERST